MSRSARGDDVVHCALARRSRRNRWSTSMRCSGVRERRSSSASAWNAGPLSLIRRPTIAWAAIPVTRNATPGRSRTPTKVAGDAKRRTSGRTSGPRRNHPEDRSFCSSNGNRRTGVRHDANPRASLRGDDPEASNVRSQRVGRFDKSRLGAIDDGAGDAHVRALSISSIGPLQRPSGPLDEATRRMPPSLKVADVLERLESNGTSQFSMARAHDARRREWHDFVVSTVNDVGGYRRERLERFVARRPGHGDRRG